MTSSSQKKSQRNENIAHVFPDPSSLVFSRAEYAAPVTTIRILSGIRYVAWLLMLSYLAYCY